MAKPPPPKQPDTSRTDSKAGNPRRTDLDQVKPGRRESATDR